MTISEAHHTTFQNVQEILKNKNSDYRGDKGEFANFELSATLTGVPVIQGILVRVSDKFARLNNLLVPGKTAQVKEESIEDTIEDIVGYLAILRAYRSQQIECVGQVDVGSNDRYPHDKSSAPSSLPYEF